MEQAQLKTTAEAAMKKAIDSLLSDLKKIRTGRANVSMLDTVKVDYYGSPTPINQVASVSCPDARTFLINPFEASILKDIEGAIVKSDLGMAPMNDGKVIRMKLPDVTEERRKELVKTTKKLVEDARVGIRMARKEANDSIKQAQKDKAISEDDSKRFQDEIQKVTDKFVAEVDKIAQDKEKDIMTL